MNKQIRVKMDADAVEMLKKGAIGIASELAARYNTSYADAADAVAEAARDLGITIIGTDVARARAVDNAKQSNADKIEGALRGNALLSTIGELAVATGLSESQVGRALKDERFERMQDRGGLIWWRLK
jgi:hypothetical protein